MIRRLFTVEAKHSLRASNSRKNVGGNTEVVNTTVIKGEPLQDQTLSENDRLTTESIAVRSLLIYRGLAGEFGHCGCEVCTWQIRRRSVMIEGIEITNPHKSIINLAEDLDKWGRVGYVLGKLYLMHSQKQTLSAISAGIGD